MEKRFVGLVLGAVVYFVAGIATWMVFPWHNSVVKKLPEETLIRDTLKVVVQDPGLYYFPNDRTENGRMNSKQYEQIYSNGPVGVLFYKPNDKMAMGICRFIYGFVEALITSAFCFWILTMMGSKLSSYGSRVVTVVLVGVFVWFNSHVPYWNWFFMPTPYVVVVLFDNIFCFGLLGLVLAKYISGEQALS